MTTSEISLLSYATNKILEGAAAGFPISLRALRALEAMSMKEGEVFTNQGLRAIFIQEKLSSESSAQKDSSTGKGELLDSGCVHIVGKVSQFSVTNRGRQMVREFNHAVQSEIEKVDLLVKLRTLLRADLSQVLEIAGLANPSASPDPTPAAETHEDVERTKSVRGVTASEIEIEAALAR